MEKLIKLLNEYEKERKSGYIWKNIDSYDNCVYGVDCDGETEITMYSDLYSKYYGFIEWLVKKDKIDHDKVYDNENYYAVDVWDNTDELLMLLAISENPISDLIYVLK